LAMVDHRFVAIACPIVRKRLVLRFTDRAYQGLLITRNFIAYQRQSTKGSGSFVKVRVNIIVAGFNRSGSKTFHRMTRLSFITAPALELNSHRNGREAQRAFANDPGNHRQDDAEPFHYYTRRRT